MHPQWPAPWGPRMRQASGLSAGRRRLAHIERDQLLASLEAMDRAADQAARARVEVVARLVGLREQLWPELVGCRARRPPPHDQPGLPPIPAGATFVSGRALRAACWVIVHRRGPIALPDLHAALHHAGYALASPRPVQALADAMGYEVSKGRALRVARGIYGPAGPAPPPTAVPDPALREPPAWDFSTPEAGGGAGGGPGGGAGGAGEGQADVGDGRASPERAEAVVGRGGSGHGRGGPHVGMVLSRTYVHLVRAGRIVGSGGRTLVHEGTRVTAQFREQTPAGAATAAARPPTGRGPPGRPCPAGPLPPDRPPLGQPQLSTPPPCGPRRRCPWSRGRRSPRPA